MCVCVCVCVCKKSFFDGPNREKRIKYFKMNRITQRFIFFKELFRSYIRARLSVSAVGRVYIILQRRRILVVTHVMCFRLFTQVQLVITLFTQLEHPALSKFNMQQQLWSISKTTCQFHILLFVRLVQHLTFRECDVYFNSKFLANSQFSCTNKIIIIIMSCRQHGYS